MINLLNIHQIPKSFSAKAKSQAAHGSKLIDSVLPSSGVREAKSQASEGDECLKSNKYDEAIDYYKKSIDLRPDYKETYLQLGKAYKGKENYPDAIQNIEIYLSQFSDDVESIILLGECYRQNGNYQQALAQFKKAKTLEPANDLAKRSLAETQNNIAACYSPDTAYKDKIKQSTDNLNQAIAMAKDYLPKGYLKNMSDLTIVFDKTAKMGETANIAQYEHSKKQITVSDSYIYAAPQIITAYLVHEFVHAKDNDSFTSVHEEQDAYRKATLYWLENARGVKDPEMDYASGLYKQSPESLDNRVAEIYRLRDPGISETSPNHPISGKKIAALNPLHNINSDQPLKTYNIIS